MYWKDLPPLSRQTLLNYHKAEFDRVKMTFKLFLNSSDLTGWNQEKDQWPSDSANSRYCNAIGKIEAAKEYTIDEIIESDQKIVVFCKHKAVVDLT
jgi:SWI/SNF-related matrix-associated actin-dependent regulator 1 of chromatin subfamily A